MQKSDRLQKFSVWKSSPTSSLKVPCKNRYGDIAYFEDYKEGVILIAFGNKEGFEPDKDGLKIDKDDLPAIIEFLKSAQLNKTDGTIE